MEKILKNPLNRAILWIIGIVFVCVIGISNVFALTTKTIYSGNSSGTLTGSGYYNYAYLTGGGTQGVSTASVGSVVSGVSYGFMFYMYEDINLQKTYTIRINFMSNDLRKEVTSSFFEVSTCNANACDVGTLVSIEKSSYTANSTWVQVKFNPINIGNSIRVDIGGDNNEALTSVSNFGISSVQIESTNANQDIINNNNNNTNNIINNNNSNTQEIIDNNNQNTQDIIDNYTSVGQSIIDNQNSIAQQQQEQQQVCEYIDKQNIITSGFLNSEGTLTSSANYGITDYIKIDKNTKLKVVLYDNNYYASFCFYNVNKELISCTRNNSVSNDAIITIPINASYVRFSIRPDTNKPQFEMCKNGNQAMQDTLTDDNVDSSSWANFFNNFTTNTFGLTSIITAPLNLIQSLTSTSCTDLQLPLPYLQNKYLTLPCMSSIYSQYFGTFFTLYQTITYGIIAYWVCVRIFNLVKDFKNPDHDEIEVVDL